MARAGVPAASRAFGAVVWMRPCVSSAVARLAPRAFRWAELRLSLGPWLRWRTAVLFVVAAQREAVRGEVLLDLLDALLPEVGDGRQLGLGLRDQVADRPHAHALEAVVGAHAQLELLDHDVVHAAAGGRLLGHRLAEHLGRLGVRGARPAPDQRARRLGEGAARVDAPIGLDLERELVVVGALADAGRRDLVAHP